MGDCFFQKRKSFAHAEELLCAKEADPTSCLRVHRYIIEMPPRFAERATQQAGIDRFDRRSVVWH
jgi:hypothetical protein